jgi:hypothetical protein
VGTTFPVSARGRADLFQCAIGNGWAAAGMLRVLATMKKADEQVQRELQSQMTDLGNWAGEIVAATAKRVVSLRLFFLVTQSTSELIRWYVASPWCRTMTGWSESISMNLISKVNLAGLHFSATLHSKFNPLSIAFQVEPANPHPKSTSSARCHF